MKVRLAQVVDRQRLLSKKKKKEKKKIKKMRSLAASWNCQLNTTIKLSSFFSHNKRLYFISLNLNIILVDTLFIYVVPKQKFS